MSVNPTSQDRATALRRAMEPLKPGETVVVYPTATATQVIRAAEAAKEIERKLIDMQAHAVHSFGVPVYPKALLSYWDQDLGRPVVKEVNLEP